MKDTFINRALRWREIERHLDGVQNILEIGAATGRFSIPLARRGFEVTHFDFSTKMLAPGIRLPSCQSPAPLVMLI